MIIEQHRRHLWQMALVGLVLAAGCTARNARYCGDGVCVDPAYPYCDLDGALEGEPRTCIAVDCTPGDFVACHADSELRCNQTGTSYDATQCELGCDAATNGCRLCEPNQTACTNGQVATCDASGMVTSSTACPLGCFEDQPRCREIDPSNGLAPYMAMAGSGPDLVLENATLIIPAGRVESASGPMDLQSVKVAASPGGVPIQVFPVRSLTIVGNLDIRTDGLGFAPQPAVAFLVYGEVRVDGSIALRGYNRSPPPGAVMSGPCIGSPGALDVGGSVGFWAGGGGGGGATQGGAGGGYPQHPGSPGGSAFLNPDLQPLRGGCSGGSPDVTLTPTYGGGALQITSRSGIRLGPNATIQANGDSGYIDQGQGTPGPETVPTGGGSGGAILLEAPVISFDSGVVLAANGGSGASGDGVPGSPATGRTPALGGTCTVAAPCTNGGDGGSSTGPGRTAASITLTGLLELYTGGGGGSVGYIRINTKDGIYTKANDVFESPSPSAGSLMTR
jgi:hypothetical protein